MMFDIINLCKTHLIKLIRVKEFYAISVYICLKNITNLLQNGPWGGPNGAVGEPICLRWSQVDPRSAQVRPKGGQSTPRWSQETPQGAPGDSQKSPWGLPERPKGAQECPGCP